MEMLSGFSGWTPHMGQILGPTSSASIKAVGFISVTTLAGRSNIRVRF